MPISCDYSQFCSLQKLSLSCLLLSCILKAQASEFSNGVSLPPPQHLFERGCVTDRVVQSLFPLRQWFRNIFVCRVPTALSDELKWPITLMLFTTVDCIKGDIILYKRYILVFSL